MSNDNPAGLRISLSSTLCINRRASTKKVEVQRDESLMTVYTVVYPLLLVKESQMRLS